MRQIGAKKRELIARVLTPGYVATARDAAGSAELVNQYIDELERLEKIVTVTERKVKIHFGNGKYYAEEL
jgi:hypothetical protein